MTGFPVCEIGRNPGGMMRDLLYLSENKMRALVPQLPGRLRRRLGFEAGLNVGMASAKATLPADSQPSSIALLDAVVEMIEREKGSLWRTDPDLRAGDWIQFDEEFRYGDAATEKYLNEYLDDSEDPVAERVYDPGTGATYLRAIGALSGLIFFAATEGSVPFVLCGSSVHVLDRWQSGDSPGKQVGYSYMASLIAYARQLGKLPDEAAATEFAPPGRWRGVLGVALDELCSETKRNSGWVTEPVQLTGHARVLAVGDGTETEGPSGVLATPLYVEYARRG